MVRRRRCSYKAEDGYLYPLDRAFFYIQKPPMLIPHNEINSIEFQRQGGGMLAGSVKTFDLVSGIRKDIRPAVAAGAAMHATNDCLTCSAASRGH